MAESRRRYTLWNIPKAEWSEPFKGVQLTEEDKKELTSFAEQLDQEKLNDRLRPFDTPVTQETLSKPVGSK
jgi:hypothetical protein